MLQPFSANVRPMSSIRRGRSQASTAISTRNDWLASPSQVTGQKRSGVRISARTLGQSSRWIVMPRPTEM